MGVSVKSRSVFGDRLRTELDRQNLSIRGLARRIDPQRPDRARRNLSRWITDEGPTRPTAASRAEVAHALGIDPSYFDEDDEEPDAVVTDIVRALFQQIDRHIAEALERRQEVPA